MSDYGLNEGTEGGEEGEGEDDALPPEVQQKIDAATAKLAQKNQQLLGLNKKMAEKMDTMDASNQQLLEKMKGEEERRLIENGDIDSVVNMRSQNALAAKDEKIRELEMNFERSQRRIDELTITDMARDAAIASGILPQATEEVRLLVGSYYRVEDGKPIGYRNGEEMLNEKGENLSMGEFIQSLAATKPYLFSKTAGAGAQGRRGEATGAKRSEMSMEQKSSYVEQHGQEAYERLPW